MPDVYVPRVVVDRVPDATALGACDGRVYVGTSHGSIFEMGAPDVELSRGRHRRIDQISSIPGTPYMACMADGYVSVSTPASLDTPTSLPLSHGASFLVAGSWLEAHSAETPTATSTSQRALGLRSMDEVAREKQKAPQNALVSMLAIACRRRRCVVMYRWVDGAFWDAKVHPLPRGPQTLALLTEGQALVAGYGHYEYVRVVIPPAHASSVAWRLPPSDALTSGTWVDTHAWDTYAVPVDGDGDDASWWGRTDRPWAISLAHGVLVSTPRRGVVIDAHGRILPPSLPWSAVPYGGIACAPYVFLREPDGSLGVYMQSTLRRAQSMTLPAGPVQLLTDPPHVYAHGSLYALDVCGLEAQLDALTAAGAYAEALDMLNAEPIDKDARAHVGLAAFVDGAFDTGMDVFMDVDMNPAYVLALYPASLTGPLAKPPSTWSALFGTRLPVHAESDAFTSPQALDALVRYLNDRRRLLRSGSLPPPTAEAVDTQCLQQLRMCDCTPDTISPHEAVAMAQVVDTALLTVFLRTKPSLVGALCRVDNWCDLAQVRTQLEARHMHQALVSLYRTRGMHTEALAQLPEPEDMAAYLDTLGPEHTDLILSHARKVLDVAPALGLSIFTSDTHLTQLPPERVAPDLAPTYPATCLAYLEAVMTVRDVAPALHTLRARLHLDACRHGAPLDAFIAFLRSSTHYDADALLLEDLPWPLVRSVLLGRLGHYVEALHLLLVEAHLVSEAEAFCVEHSTSAGPDLYATLLRLVRTHAPEHLLRVCEGVLTQHAKDVPLPDILALLPPEWPVQRVQALLLRNLHAQASDRVQQRIESALSTAHRAALDQSVRIQRQARVLVTDHSTCEQCGRRLAQLVLAVVPATGATMHYYCAMQHT